MLDLVGVQVPPPQGGCENGVARHLDTQDGELKHADQDQDTQQLHAAGGGSNASAGHHRQYQSPLGLWLQGADIQSGEAGTGLGAERLQRCIRRRHLAQGPQNQGSDGYRRSQRPQLQILDEAPSPMDESLVENRERQGAEEGYRQERELDFAVLAGKAVREGGEAAGGDSAEGVNQGFEDRQTGGQDQTEAASRQQEIDCKYPSKRAEWS